MHAEFSQAAHAEFSTDYTGSALQERYCKLWVLRGLKMAVGWLHLFAAMSSLSKSVRTGQEVTGEILTSLWGL